MEKTSTSSIRVGNVEDGARRSARGPRRFGTRLAAAVVALGLGSGSSIALVSALSSAPPAHAVAFEHVWDCCHIAQ
ncbi:MAG: hypothetical protein M1522_02545 [Actinobacteria bacterium]|jgi:hypothetical protein|nr:hypothetical protein [Actinomycetota bacterium]MDA8186388.1 hypothetical protein [Actinomycetota bacterium]